MLGQMVNAKKSSLKSIMFVIFIAAMLLLLGNSAAASEDWIEIETESMNGLVDAGTLMDAEDLSEIEDLEVLDSDVSNSYLNEDLFSVDDAISDEDFSDIMEEEIDDELITEDDYTETVNSVQTQAASKPAVKKTVSNALVSANTGQSTTTITMVILALLSIVALISYIKTRKYNKV